MLKKLGIGTKITFIISFIIILALVFVGITCSNQSTASLEQSLKDNLQTKATQNAKIISTTLDMYKNSAMLTASRTRIQSMDFAQQKAILISDAESNGFTRIGVAKLDGSLTYPDGTKSNISDRTYFKNTLNGETYISDPIISKSTGNLTIYISTPIYNADKKLAGVLVCNLDNSFISNLIKDIKGSESGYCFVLNSQGTVIGHKNQTLVETQDNVFNNLKKDKTLSGLASVVTKMDNGVTGTDQYTYKGNTNYISYTTISNTTWSIGVVASKKEVFSNVAALQKSLMLSSIFFIVISIVLCLLLITFMVTRPLRKTVKMIEDLSAGRLSTRLKVRSHDEVGKMSLAMNNMADILQNDIVGNMKKISKGDMTAKVEIRSQQDEIMPALSKMIGTVRSITKDTQKIISAAKQGNLDERCDTARYSGSWAELTSDINSLMDTVAAPIEELRGVLSRMSVNDYTAKMNGEYNGIFKNMAGETNTVREKLLDIQDTIIQISNGETGKLAEIKEAGKSSENDMLVPAIIKMMETINALMEEVLYLSQESVKGNILEVRGNADKFEGGFKETIVGFNNTLDAISEPMREIGLMLKALSVNDFTTTISGSYQGDYKVLVDAANGLLHNLQTIQTLAEQISEGDIGILDRMKSVGAKSENDKLSPALIQMMENIQDLINETTKIAQSAAAGNLKIRGDETRFEGGYQSIIKAVNEFLTAVEQPTDEIKRVLVEMSEAHFDISIEGEYQGDFAVLTDSVNILANALNSMAKELSDKMSRIAGGDFSMERVRDYRGDFQTVSEALNTILDTFNKLFANIKSTAEQVAAGSNQVSAGSQTLSQGATEQASSVEELSATITEIASQIKHNALSAGKTAEMVIGVKQSADNGKVKMNQMQASMNEISEATADISKIIRLIDDISFQTNILSLNAAVEAARAGQAGKGFAVVAQEVKSLAAHSAEAAKETSELIEATSKKVAGGTALANETASEFGNITDGIAKVSDLVSEITAASKEQATGISQIDSGIGQISAVVQTNSATAEESAAASEELSGQADMLNEQISSFVLREDDSRDEITSRQNTSSILQIK